MSSGVKSYRSEKLQVSKIKMKMQIHASLNSAVSFTSTLVIGSVNYLDVGQEQTKSALEGGNNLTE